MLGVSGKWLISFSLGELKDFVTNDMLQSFTLTSYAGGKLPEYSLTLKVYGREVIRYINESQVINLSYGREIDDLRDTSLSMSLPVITPSGNDSYIIDISGFINNLNYINNPIVNITGNISGTSAIQRAATQHFQVEKNYTDSNESQKWIQPAITNRSFITDTWLHTDLGAGNAPLIGITPDGVFRIYDLKRKLANKPDYILRTQLQDDDRSKNTILINPDYSVIAQDGVLNSWFGYDQDLLTWDLNSGSESLSNIQPSTIISTDSKLAKSSGVSSKVLPNAIVTDNVHSNWNATYANNLNMLAVLSSSRIECNFTGELLDINVLDLVQFHDSSQRIDQDIELQDYYTGSYIISTLTTHIEESNINTHLTLCRDAMSTQKTTS